MPHGTLIAGWPVHVERAGVRQHLERALQNHSASGAFAGGSGVAFIGSVGISSRS